MSHLKRLPSRGRFRTAAGSVGEARKQGRRASSLRCEALEERVLLAVTAVPDAFGVVENAPLNVAAPGLLANDSDTTGRPLTVVSSTQPAHGSVAVNPNGSFTYTPAANYVGADSFSYTAGDGTGATSLANVNLNVVACTPQACVFAGPRLASVNSAQGPLLNAVLGGLLGTSLNLTAVDYNSLTNASISGSKLLNQLQTNLGLASPSQALTTNITVTQFLTAAAQVAQADGNTAEATALNNLNAQAGPVAGTIQLGNLLQGTLNNGNLANVNFNTLDLVTGAVQLFNFQNVATTPTPTTISGAQLAALGLPATVGSLKLYAQVVEPPIFTCGPVGTTFHTAAVRLKFDMNNLTNLNLDTSSLVGAISGALGVPAGLLTVTANVNDLQVYVEVASASGTIQMINAATGAVTLQATPSIANVYIGSIADSVFFNRTHIINPATDLTFATVGNLTVAGPLGLNLSAGIQVRDFALGQAPAGPTTLTFNPPYPAPPQTVGSSSAAAANLSTQLATNLQVQLSGTPAPLAPIAGALATDLVNPIVNGVLTPVVAPLLTGVVDPLLNTLGIGIGEAIVDVSSVGLMCPPIANNDFAITPVNTPIAIPVLNNDATMPGDTITITGTTQPSHGTAVVNPNGTITYAPNSGFTGTDTFTYTITDANGAMSTATVTVTVTPPPVANNDAYNTPENTTLVVPAPGVQANDLDPTGRPLTSTVVTGPTHGAVTLNPNGSLTYVPNTGYIGPDSFTYQDSDGLSTSNVATVNLNVTPPVAQPPVANNDAYTTPQNTTLVVPAPGVQGNDVNSGGGALTSTVVTGPTHGAVTLNPNGSLTYVPNPGYIGPDSFTYHDTNANGTSNTATVSLNVTPTAPPVANNDAYSTPQGVTLTVPAPGVQGNDVNSGGGALTSTVVTGPTHGAVTLNPNGSLTYVPNPGYIGPDSFTYHDTNANGTSNTATVSLNVTPTAPPVANNDAYSTPQNITLVVPAPGVQGNDLSPTGKPLTSTVVTGPVHGAVTLNPNGSLTYVPNPGYVGPDSFTYHDSDGNNFSNTATVSLNVTPAANLAPVANNDAYSTPQGVTLIVPAPGVQGNDTNPGGGGALTSTVVTGPTHGAVTLNPNGSLTYVPNPGYTGPDSFTYHDTNANGTSNTATVSLNVTPPPVQPPVANNDTYSTPQGVTLIVPAPGVQGNDTNPGGGTLVSIQATQATHGTATLNPDGSLTYVPNPGFTGQDTFTYLDSNGTATSNVATVTVNVTPPANPAPVANNDNYTTPEGTTLTVPAPGVQLNDVNSGGGALTSTVVTGPVHGAVTLNPNGSLTYVPNPGFTGQDTFTYHDTNGNGTSNAATVTVNVTPTAPPVANNDAYATPEGTTLNVPAPGILGNDVSVSGLPLTPTVVANPSHGTVTVNPNGSLTYVPVPGYIGPDLFRYQDSDGNNPSNIATVFLTVTPTLPPVANNDAYTTPQGVTLTVPAPGVQGNDLSPTGKPLTSTVVTGPVHGAVTLNPNGSLTYVPNPGYTGPDSFTYHDSDGNNFSNTATVSLNVTPPPVQPPVANNDTYSTPEGATLVVPAPGVQGNDVNSGGGALTSTVVTGPVHGAVTLNPNGSLTYVPNPGFTGQDTFTYHDTNGNGTSNAATVTLVVSPTAAPVAIDDAYTTPQATTLVVPAPGILGNDVSVSGLPLTSAVVAQPTHGTVTVNPNGSITYVPNPTFAGTDTFTYRDSDGNNLSNVATVTLTVTPAAPPLARNDAYSTPEGVTLTVPAPGVQVNDVDPTGRPMTSTVVTGPAHGTLTLNADGSLTYVPNPGYTGPDVFTYQDSDGLATSNVATVNLIITPPTLPPVANNDAYSTPQGVTLIVPAPGVQGNDTNPGGGTLTSTVTTQPTHGTVTLNPNGSLTYIPNPGYVGPDSFIYTDSNGTATSNPATVAINVTPAALQPPVAINDAYSTPEGTTLTVAAPGVQGNDTNPGGGTLTSTVTTQPTHGTVTLNPNGSLTYIPNPGYVGPDSFIYTDSNGTATSNPATVAINVTPTSPPVAINDAYSTPQGVTLTVPAPGVLGNDVSPTGKPLTDTVVVQPTHGALTLNPNGSLTYVPNPTYVGPDFFTYQDSDGNNTSNVATVSLTVTPAASLAPVANNDAYTTPQGVTLIVGVPGVQGNDTNPGGGALTSTVVAQPTHGTVTLNPSGSLTYVPNPGFNGQDTFTYTDSNGTATSNVATVTLIVTPPALQPPVANNDNYTTPEGTTLTVFAPGVQLNDANSGGGALASTVVTGPTHGTVTLNPSGSLTYVPTPGFTGVDTFTYTDSNANGTSNVATVTLIVSPTSPPVAINDAYSTPQGVTLTVPAPGILGNDVSPTGKPLTPAVVAQPTHGTLTLNPDGSLTYVPNPGYVGPDLFRYQDSDGNNPSNIATVSLTVTPATNLAPVANNDAYTTPQGVTLTVAAPGVQGNDTNPGGGTLASTVVTPPTRGTLTLNSNGSLTYVPNPGFVGTDIFTYHNSNGTATSNTATVTVIVTPPANLAPVANDDAYSTPEGTTLTVPAPGVQANDTNPGGGTLTSTVLTGPTHGTVTLNPDGSLTYVPNPGFVGQDIFTYTDSNGGATSNAATVAVNVSPTARPVANNDNYTTPQGTTLVVAAPGILGNDVSVSGLPLTPAVVAQPKHGTVTVNPNGSITYVPNPGFVGTDTFTYLDSDGNNISNVATVTLTVTPNPAGPVANDDHYTTPEGMTLVVAPPGVLGNDTNPGGGTISAVPVTSPTHGTLTLNPDGSFIYTPNPGFFGADSFTYHDVTPTGVSNTATVSLIVPPPPLGIMLRVVTLQRFGYHDQPTAFVLTFTEPLDPSRARNLGNYRLTPAGDPGAAIPIAAAVYNPGDNTVTLYTANPVYIFRQYTLTVNGSAATGLRGLNGLPLDGFGDGTPGSNFSRTFGSEILAGTDFGRVPQPFAGTQSAAHDAAIEQLASQPGQRSKHR